MRRSPGEGTAFYSEVKSCWIWRTPVGTKANGKVQYKSGRAKSRAEAINKMRLAAVKKEQPKRATTVAQYAETWLEDLAQRVRPSSYNMADIAAKKIVEHIGKCKIESVTADTIRQFKLSLDQNKKSMVHSATYYLLAMCAHAQKHGYNMHDLSSIKLVKPKRQEVEVFSSDEVKKLIATEGDAKLLCCIASGTGMRIGEIIALRWSDFRSDFRQVTVSRTFAPGEESRIGPPKTKNGHRTIALPEYLSRLIQEAYQTSKSKWVFPSPAGSQTGFIYGTTVHRYFMSQCKLAKVKHRRFHIFRHTHASELLQAGIPLAEVARRLGDTITTVVNTYSHWIRPDDRTPQVIDKLYS